MGLLDSLTNLVSDVVTVALKPAEIVLDLTDAAVKPLADGLTEIANDVKDLTR
jgi:hypothetical protein